jgi:hypothetical protein
VHLVGLLLLRLVPVHTPTHKNVSLTVKNFHFIPLDCYVCNCSVAGWKFSTQDGICFFHKELADQLNLNFDYSYKAEVMQPFDI